MKKFCIFIFLIVSIVSCTDISDDISVGDMSKNEVIVLKKRDPNYPWVPSDYKSIGTKTRNVTKDYPGLAHRRFLGYSLKNDVYPLEDTRNLGYQVIDIDKLYKDYPKYLDAWKNNTGFANRFSYATFDRYVSNSTVTNSISGGAKLNLGLFSIGNKNSLSTVFSKAITEEQNATFGELNIIVRDSCYRMQYSSNIQEKINAKYLSELFKDELYNTHPSEFFSNYGGFVLTNYVVGGKATAQYVGIYKKSEKNETRETKMNNEIDASYGFNVGDKGGSVSGNLALGRGNNSATSVTNEFSSIVMSIKTVGGNSSFASFSIPKEVKNTDVDLSAWVTSLNDKNTHNIVEFGDESLIPITDFIVEENLKKQINEYYETGINSIQKLSEPYISIELNYFNSQFRTFETYLHTRFGDKVGLRTKGIMFHNIEQLASIYLREETERVSKMFGLKVVNNTNYRNLEKPVNYNIDPSKLILFDGFNEIHLKKFLHDGTIYIVSDAIYHYQQKKSALSIHEDRYMDDYVMRDLIKRLPTVNMTYDELVKNYNINAL